jgi:hypothetical protein
MPNWDDHRGSRQDGRRQDSDQDRGRREARGRNDWDWERSRQGPERRSFDPNERSNRTAARYDQDRMRDAGAAGYSRAHSEAEDVARYGRPRGRGWTGEPDAYRGQEYGVESHRDEPRGQPMRRGSFDYDDPGVGQSQAGYGPSAQSHPDHDLEPDYLSWREQQMRDHDRDYEDWRREQHQHYDRQYRQFRAERQRHFGQAFHEWRSQRSAVGGIPDTTVVPGVSGYGDKSAIPGGYNSPNVYDKPTGELDPPGHLSADPAMRQTGGTVPHQGQHTGRTASGEDPSTSGAAFNQAAPGVQAASDGDVRRDTDHDHAKSDHDQAKSDHDHDKNDQH